MDWPPRGHITTRPNRPPITDGRTGNVPQEGSYEAAVIIARVGKAMNPDWQPGTVERSKQSDDGKPHGSPSRRTRAITCSRCGEVQYTANILSSVCNECRADHDRDLRLARQRRAVERRANELA